MKVVQELPKTICSSTLIDFETIFSVHPLTLSPYGGILTKIGAVFRKNMTSTTGPGLFVYGLRHLQTAQDLREKIYFQVKLEIYI